VSSGYGEFEPELKGQFESKIEGLLSGNTNVIGASGWHPKSLGSYSHFEITNIEPYSHGFEATAKVYFTNKVESLYLRTDSSAEEITEVSMGFPLPGTGPDDSPKKEPVDPKRRRPKPGKGTGKKQGPAGLID
jgi:hypothetical protein